MEELEYSNTIKTHRHRMSDRKKNKHSEKQGGDKNCPIVENVINEEHKDIFGGLVKEVDSKYLMASRFCDKNPDSFICKAGQNVQKPLSCFLHVISELIKEGKLNQEAFDKAWNIIKQTIKGLPEKIDISGLNLDNIRRKVKRAVALALLCFYLPIIIALVIIFWISFAFKRVTWGEALWMTGIIIAIFGMLIMIYVSSLDSLMVFNGKRVVAGVEWVEKLFLETMAGTLDFKMIINSLNNAACGYVA